MKKLDPYLTRKNNNIFLIVFFLSWKKKLFKKIKTNPEFNIFHVIFEKKM